MTIFYSLIANTKIMIYNYYALCHIFKIKYLLSILNLKLNNLFKQTREKKMLVVLKKKEINNNKNDQ